MARIEGANLERGADDQEDYFNNIERNWAILGSTGIYHVKVFFLL